MRSVDQHVASLAPHRYPVASGRAIHCPECFGKGWIPDGCCDAEVCGECSGRGRVVDWVWWDSERV